MLPTDESCIHGASSSSRDAYRNYSPGQRLSGARFCRGHFLLTAEPTHRNVGWDRHCMCCGDVGGACDSWICPSHPGNVVALRNHSPGWRGLADLSQYAHANFGDQEHACGNVAVYWGGKYIWWCISTGPACRSDESQDRNLLCNVVYDLAADRCACMSLLCGGGHCFCGDLHVALSALRLLLGWACPDCLHPHSKCLLML